MIGALQTLVGFSMCWLITSSLAIYPHSLSYFNESVGGPLNGHKHLLGSNVDWGQDLRYLKWWADEHPPASHGGALYLAYFGYFDPSDTGLAFTRPWPTLRDAERRASSPNRRPIDVAAKPPGMYAMSVNLRLGYPYNVRDGESAGKRLVLLSELRPIGENSPIGGAGYSIQLFSINK